MQSDAHNMNYAPIDEYIEVEDLYETGGFSLFFIQPYITDKRSLRAKLNAFQKHVKTNKLVPSSEFFSESFQKLINENWFTGVYYHKFKDNTVYLPYISGRQLAFYKMWIAIHRANELLHTIYFCSKHNKFRVL